MKNPVQPKAKIAVGKFDDAIKEKYKLKGRPCNLAFGFPRATFFCSGISHFIVFWRYAQTVCSLDLQKKFRSAALQWGRIRCSQSDNLFLIFYIRKLHGFYSCDKTIHMLIIQIS
jgi:hypothetical protein